TTEEVLDVRTRSQQTIRDDLLVLLRRTGDGTVDTRHHSVAQDVRRVRHATRNLHEAAVPRRVERRSLETLLVDVTRNLAAFVIHRGVHARRETDCGAVVRGRIQVVLRRVATSTVPQVDVPRRAMARTTVGITTGARARTEESVARHVAAEEVTVHTGRTRRDLAVRRLRDTGVHMSGAHVVAGTRLDAEDHIDAVVGTLNRQRHRVSSDDR